MHGTADVYEVGCFCMKQVVFLEKPNRRGDFFYDRESLKLMKIAASYELFKSL